MFVVWEGGRDNWDSRWGKDKGCRSMTLKGCSLLRGRGGAGGRGPFPWWDEAGVEEEAGDWGKGRPPPQVETVPRPGIYGCEDLWSYALRPCMIP